jgi:hypothetical protein
MALQINAVKDVPFTGFQIVLTDIWWVSLDREHPVTRPLPAQEKENADTHSCPERHSNPTTTVLRLRLGIDCARLPGAAVRARQTRSFVYRVRVQPRAVVDRRCSSDTRPSQLKEHSTLKYLCRGTKKPLRFGSTRAKFARGSIRSAALGNKVSTLRGKATNIASSGSRKQSIPGLRLRGHSDWQLQNSVTQQTNIQISNS